MFTPMPLLYPWDKSSNSNTSPNTPEGDRQRFLDLQQAGPNLFAPVIAVSCGETSLPLLCFDRKVLIKCSSRVTQS